MLRSASSCLDETTLLAFAAHELDREGERRAEAHLAECSTCRERLNEISDKRIRAAAAETERSTTRNRNGSADPAAERAKLPAEGELIAARYRVERSLGRGGMGSVVAATQIALGQRVAIKILHATDADSVARFVREGRTLAQLSSPHIVQVYDSGQLANGTPYLVMEYLEGQDLSGLSGNKALEIRTAVSYVRQACTALSLTHSAGIVHRDLKPSNLFLTQLNGTPTIKVLDFGVSKRIRPDANSLALTSSSTILGSPRYMSPEQLNASSRVDHTTDIWSLGVVLYELLTAKVPYPQDTLTSLLLAIATQAPTPPRKLRPELPARLEAIVLRCLEKNPARRFPSVAELSAALLPFESEQAPEPPRIARPLFFALVGTLAAAGLGALWCGQRGASTRSEQARAPVAGSSSPAPQVERAIEPPVAGCGAAGLPACAGVSSAGQVAEPATEPPRSPPPARAPRKPKHKAQPVRAVGPTDTPD